MIEADATFNNRDFILAKQLYNEILDLDANNLRAKEGLRRATIFSEHAVTVEYATTLMGPDDEGNAQAADLLRGVLVEDPDNIK